ncbi:MAG: PKD domain-containing protein, partial [Nanoarchaeota archaeon]
MVHCSVWKQRIMIICVLFMLSSLVYAEDPSIKAVPEEGAVPLSVSFEVKTEEPITSYAWDFNGDGKTDSTEAMPTFTYTLDGAYIATVSMVTEAGEARNATMTITARTAMTVSVTASTQSGTAPLNVQFTAAATGKEPLSYAWDFNADGAADSTTQNPFFTFDTPGEYNVTLTVRDSTGNSIQRNIPITVTLFDSKLELQSYFPTTLSLGENQVTFLVTNSGTMVVKDISAKVIAPGLQHLTTSSLSRLAGGETDSLTVKVNVVQEGMLQGSAKILDKTFPINFTVAKQAVYNKEELQGQLDGFKRQVQEQESIYYQKKAEGYLISEVFDSIKAVRNKLEAAQQNILLGKLADAKVTLDLVGSSLQDINISLSEVKQQEKSILDWTKENIVAITVIITGLWAL